MTSRGLCGTRSSSSIRAMQRWESIRRRSFAAELFRLLSADSGDRLLREPLFCLGQFRPGIVLETLAPFGELCNQAARGGVCFELAPCHRYGDGNAVAAARRVRRDGCGAAFVA